MIYLNQFSLYILNLPTKRVDLPILSKQREPTVFGFGARHSNLHERIPIVGSAATVPFAEPVGPRANAFFTCCTLFNRHQWARCGEIVTHSQHKYCEGSPQSMQHVSKFNQATNGLRKKKHTVCIWEAAKAKLIYLSEIHPNIAAS